MRGEEIKTYIHTKQGVIDLAIVPYSGKFSRGKTFVNFVVLSPFTKVFSAKFGGMAFFGVAKASNL